MQKPARICKARVVVQTRPDWTVGDLTTIVEIHGDAHPCLDPRRQVPAVERAVAWAKFAVVQDQVDRRLEDDNRLLLREQCCSIDELQDIPKYLRGSDA